MKKLSEADKEKIKNEYLNWKSTTQISESFNIHRSTVQYTLKAKGVSLRKRTSSFHDINFFNSFTKDSCYWAGFILADGWIGESRLDIGLAKRDKEHLLKFKNAIKYEGNLHEDISSNAFRIQIRGTLLQSGLRGIFGIKNNKSVLNKLPEVPENFLHHFIRGLYDGDGGCTYTTCLTINFTSTLGILDDLRQIFYKKCNVKLKSKNRYPPIQQKKKVGQISYSGKNALKVLDWLYEDSTDQNRLDRKYNLLKEFYGEELT